jgi:predicted GIY-YIG superfamily endonuclease
MSKYTVEKILSAAALCSSKKEFRSNFNGEYQAAHRLKIMDQASAHMSPLGNMAKRWNYSILFDDGSVYVGLSFDVNKRIKSHSLGHLIGDKMSENSYTVFTHGGLKSEVDASIDEILLVEHLRASGYKVLNKIKAGGVGGYFKKWTTEKIKKAAMSCSSTMEFSKKFRGAYVAASKRGMLKAGEFDFLRDNKRHLNEDIFKIAKRFKTRISFQKQSRKEYDIAWRRGILEQACAHMPYLCTPKKGENHANLA